MQGFLPFQQTSTRPLLALVFPIAIIFSLFSCSTSCASTVTVNGNVFHLASSAKTENETLREFLPKGQKLETWTRLVSIRHITNQESPKDYIIALAKTYNASYPHMKFAAGGEKDEWYIDFIAYPRGEKPKLAFAEWNFFIARKHETKGIIVFQYAERAYSEKAGGDEFKKLDADGLRKRFLEKLKKEKFKENVE